MSRAFVKEPDGDHADEEVVEKPQSDFPNYMTLSGLQEMKQNLEELKQQYRELKKDEGNMQIKNQIKRIEADLRYLEKRIQCAILVDTSKIDSSEIRFGAQVSLVDENDKHYQFRIVGEDEADVEKGLISWVSPLASELIGKKTGDVLIWERPSGDLELEVLDFSYN